MLISVTDQIEKSTKIHCRIITEITGLKIKNLDQYILQEESIDRHPPKSIKTRETVFIYVGF